MSTHNRVSIVKKELEIAGGPLNKPVITVGRSPTCDIILRAEGVAPVHYLIEWLGDGKYEREKGRWSVLDISHPSENDEGQGGLLGTNPSRLGGFLFSLTRDRLAHSDDLHGGIKSSLDVLDTPESLSLSRSGLLEIVQIRSDSGAVEEVRHLKLQECCRTSRPLREIPQFRFRCHGEDVDSPLAISLEEMPGAQIFIQGRKQNGDDRVPVHARSLVQVIWNGREIYLRMVPSVAVPKTPFEMMKEPALRRSFLVSLLGFLLIAALIQDADIRLDPSLVSATPSPYVIRLMVEKPAKVASKSVPTPEPTPRTLAKEKIIRKREAAQSTKIVKKNRTEKMKLSGPSPMAQAETGGFLKKLRQMVDGQQKADEQVIRQVIGQSRVQPKNEMDGAMIQSRRIDLIAGETEKVAVQGPSLGSLSSALTDPRFKSEGKALSINRALNREGGKIDEGLNHLTRSQPAGGLGPLAVSTAEFSVEGGLSREIVKRVIDHQKSRIRVCYERALIGAPLVSGRIAYSFQINSMGRVISAGIRSNHTSSPVLASCVHEVIAQMIFPQSQNGRDTIVLYPFEFSQGGE